MFTTKRTTILLAMSAFLLGVATPTVMLADEALDQAFETLKTYDWGDNRAPLEALDKAVAASHKDAAAKKALAGRLEAVLKSDAPRAAKDVVCRKLSLIGTSDSVPVLASLLGDEKLSHMGRYALERIPGEDSLAALREALTKTKGPLKVGMINSLGARRDAKSTATMAALLTDEDKTIAAAATAALGAIGTPEAAKALGAFQAKTPKELKLAAADAYLACAEQLLLAGKKADAKKIYMSLMKPTQPKHIRVAATRGMLAASKK